jgi:hypothetical protein
MPRVSGRNRCKCPASAPAWPECCNLQTISLGTGLATPSNTHANADGTDIAYTNPASNIDANHSVVHVAEVEGTLPRGVGVDTLRGVERGDIPLSNIRPNLTSIPHQPIQRVLAGEVQTSDYKLAKRQAKALASRSIDEAIRTVLGVMRTSKQDKVRLDAAKFLIEMVAGKPKVDQGEEKPQGFKADGLEDDILEAILEEEPSN